MNSMRNGFWLAGLVVLVLVAGVGSVARVGAAACQWTGAVSTDWATPSNWTSCGGGIPGVSDTATIPNVANQPIIGGSTSATVSGLSINSGATVTVNGTLTLGNLSGDGGLTVNGALIWNGGVWSGTGATTLASGATMTISSGSTKTLDGRAVTNRGTVNVTGAERIYFKNGAVFNNQAGATFGIQVDVMLDYDEATPATTFNNAGSVVKSSGSGIATIEPVFNNSGALTVTSGILALTGGGSSSGAFSVGTGSTLRFGGGAHTLTNAALTGAGSAEITAGTVNMSGSGMTVSTAVLNLVGGAVNSSVPLTVMGVFNWSGGSLTVNGPMTVTQALNWSGGTAGGAGVTTIVTGATLTFSGVGDKTVDGRTLINKGVTNVTGTGRLYFNNGAVFTNQTGATMDIQVDVLLEHASGSVPTLNNEGALTKSGGTGTTTVKPILNNSGVVNIASGILALTGGGSSSGAFGVGAGSTLRFGGGTHTLTNASLSGQGTIEITTGAVNLGGAPVTIATGGLTLSGGALSSSVPLTVTSVFNWSAGTLTVNGPTTVTQALNWSGGTMDGAGVTTLAPGATMTFDGSTTKTIDGRTLINNNMTRVTGTGPISFKNGAVFNNRAGATFDIQVNITTRLYITPRL